MNKKRLTYVISIIILIAIIVSICVIKNNSTNDENALETINVSEVTRSVFYAPQYVAINNGFFEKNGIKIELTTSAGADAVMT